MRLRDAAYQPQTWKMLQGNIYLYASKWDHNKNAPFLFESNYEDTKISKSIWGDNNENVNYILGIGDYEVQLDNADYTKGKTVARYVLNVK